MTEHSITDVEAAGGDQSMFNLLWRLPTAWVFDFLSRALEWEADHRLAGRLAEETATARAAVAQVPSLAGRSDQIARACVAQRLRSHLCMCTLLAQLERDEDTPLEVQWRGREHVERARAGGRPVVVYAPHLGFYYLVPYVLAKLGVRSSALGSDGVWDRVGWAGESIAPGLTQRVTYLPVPDVRSAQAALDTLVGGGALVVFAEQDRGATAAVRSVPDRLLGRPYPLSIAPARYARLTGAAIVPALVAADGDRRVRIEFHTPLPPPVHRRDDHETARQLLRWLERVVEQRPELWWWGWPRLDTELSTLESPALVP